MFKYLLTISVHEHQGLLYLAVCAYVSVYTLTTILALIMQHVSDINSFSVTSGPKIK